MSWLQRLRLQRDEYIVVALCSPPAGPACRQSQKPLAYLGIATHPRLVCDGGKEGGTDPAVGDRWGCDAQCYFKHLWFSAQDVIGTLWVPCCASRIGCCEPCWER